MIQPGDVLKLKVRGNTYQVRVTRIVGVDLKPGFIQAAWPVDAPVRPNGLPRDFQKFIVRARRLQALT